MAKVDKKEARLRRAQSTRHRIRELMVPRLTVHRSGQHIYAQVLAAGGSGVVAAASTVQKEVREGLGGTDQFFAKTTGGRWIIHGNVANDLL